MSEEHHEEEVAAEEEVEVVEVVEAEASTGAEIAIRPPGHEVLMPMDTGQVVEGMKAYQKLLQDLLEPTDWQQTRDGKFPKKSAWRKIARAFNLSLVKISLTVERDGSGNPIRAEAVFRAVAPNGQIQDGDGYCSIDEPRFEQAGGRQKIENDLRATATTRAKNRAISDLVGMGEVSAEEVDAGEPLPVASTKQREVLMAALEWLLPDGDVGELLGMITTEFGGEIPGAAANVLIKLIKARKDEEEGAGS